jgi:chemotaxis protein CheD
VSDGSTTPLFPVRKGNDRYRQSGEPNRFYDPRFRAISVTVLPGRHYVTAAPGEMIVTLLGSCVAACIRDPVAGVGGLNHFLLPESDNGLWGEASAAMRYGNHAMETLINDIIKRGGDRGRLEFKVFGGGNVIDIRSTQPVGSRNVEFIERYLANEGFRIAAKHLGGTLPRRIHYFPTTGKVNMLLLRRSPDNEVFRRDLDFGRKAKIDEDNDDIELFD